MDVDNSVELTAGVCPLCSAPESTFWATEQGFTVVRCNSCRLLYVSPMPNSVQIQEAVVSGLQKADNRVLNVRSRRSPKKIKYYQSVLGKIFSDMLPVRASDVTWLDVGAGYGESMQAVLAIGGTNLKVVGVEPMKHKAEIARSFGLEIHNCFLQPNQFQVDVLSVVDIFSHIPDFSAFLAIAHSNLKDAGQLFIETGNLADLNERSEFPNELGLPDHLVFAGEAHIQDYLRRAGFEIVSIRRVRMDGFINLAKNFVKLIIGRNAALGIPYKSRYRQLQIRARKIQSVAKHAQRGQF